MVAEETVGLRKLGTMGWAAVGRSRTESGIGHMMSGSGFRV